MTRFSSSVRAVLMAGVVAAGFAGGAVAEDKVIATINGKPITEGDLAVAESEVGADMGSLPAAQKRMSLLESTISFSLKPPTRRTSARAPISRPGSIT